MAWGYGVSLTPLQILTFYNAIANDGEMVKPRFVNALRSGGKVEKVFEKEVLHPKIASDVTLSKLRTVLENVVKKGTADNIYSDHFSMAGKTGTAKNTYQLQKIKMENLKAVIILTSIMWLPLQVSFLLKTPCILVL